MSFRRLLLVWTGLALVGWLVGAEVWLEREAGCNESNSFICFDERDIWLATGVLTGGIWLFGVLVLAIAGLLVRGRSRR